jgi:hypothetical protein
MFPLAFSHPCTFRYPITAAVDLFLPCPYRSLHFALRYPCKAKAKHHPGTTVPLFPNHSRRDGSHHIARFAPPLPNSYILIPRRAVPNAASEAPSFGFSRLALRWNLCTILETTTTLSTTNSTRTTPIWIFGKRHATSTRASIGKAVTRAKVCALSRGHTLRATPSLGVGSGTGITCTSFEPRDVPYVVARRQRFMQWLWQW